MCTFFIYKDVKIHYVSIGKGETTLFLHGWEGCVDSFLFVANNVKGNKILIDFPPFGKSENLKIAWTLDDYVNCVLYLLNVMKIQKCNIVAHSFGGRVAIKLASKQEGEFTIEKMVLTGCAGIKDKNIKTKLKTKLYKIKKFLAKMKVIGKVKLLQYGSKDYVKLNPTMKQTFVNIVNCDLTRNLKKITCSVLLLWGKKDTATPLKHAKIMKKKIKNSGLYVFENGTHFAYLEHTNEFINAVKIFLNL